jgi:hypothetical protein
MTKSNKNQQNHKKTELTDRQLKEAQPDNILRMAKKPGVQGRTRPA